MKPILFNTEMVRAILDGRKTTTRRPMKNAPLHPGRWGFSMFTPKGHISFRSDVEIPPTTERIFKMPYQKGDILSKRPTKTGWYEVQWEPGDKWERVWLFDGGECWGASPNDDPESVTLDIANPELTRWKTLGDIVYVREMWGKDKHGKYHYRADYPEHDYEPYPIWHPSIHMPKEAARIFLKVTDVRVERVQDINEEGAKEEGVRDPYDYQSPEYYEQSHLRGMEINESAFAGLWDSIYGNWNNNPWVWVISFEVVKEV